MYEINSELLKFKLEPIINICSGETIAFEILSYSVTRPIDMEVFFNNLNETDLLSVFERQLEYFQKLNEQDGHLFHTLFINIDPKLLKRWCNAENVEACFIPFSTRFNINIEIDANKLPPKEYQAICTPLLNLNGNGIKLWLDDVDHIQLYKSHTFFNLFDGIKLDKKLLWKSAKEDNSSHILEAISLWGSDNIITEGVEMDEYVDFLRKNELIYGQGYIWHATYPILEPCSQHLKTENVG